MRRLNSGEQVFEALADLEKDKAQKLNGFNLAF